MIGQIKTREYTDKNEQTRRVTEIVASTVQPIDWSGSVDPRKNREPDDAQTFSGFSDDEIPF